MRQRSPVPAILAGLWPLGAPGLTDGGQQVGDLGVGSQHDVGAKALGQHPPGKLRTVRIGDDPAARQQGAQAAQRRERRLVEMVDVDADHVGPQALKSPRFLFGRRDAHPGAATLEEAYLELVNASEQ